MGVKKLWIGKMYFTQKNQIFLVSLKKKGNRFFEKKKSDFVASTITLLASADRKGKESFLKIKPPM